MLFSTVTRTLAYKSMTLARRGVPQVNILRLMSSIVPSSEVSSPTLDRFKVTAEVTVSKIFPAGFGWQSSSILARDFLGYAPDTLGFALTTGLGDGIGVFLGHCAYNVAKKNATGDDSINMERETQTGILLGSAAFCSGTAWQPIVNVLQAADLSFFQVFAGTWMGCGTAFYLGIRGARTILSGPFQHIKEPTFENSITDKSLSAAIGGATGFFVGTDTGEYYFSLTSHDDLQSTLSLFCHILYRSSVPARPKLLDRHCGHS
jgi:hypothetical protein